MHPRLYPFIVNGPACACGHRRVAHVGMHGRYELSVADVACTECPCDNYTPVEAIDHEAEARQRDQIYRDQMRRTIVHRKITSLLAVATVAIVPVIVWNRDLFLWLLVPVLLAGITNTAVASVGQWRSGELDAFDATITGSLTAVALAFVLALVTTSPFMFGLFVTILAFGLVLALRARTDIGRSKRTFEAMVTDLEDRLRDDDS